MDRRASFWTSRTFLIALALSAVGTVFLLSGHRAHLLGAIPYLFLLACPLMHFLGGHGSHHHHHDRTQRWPGDEEEHL
ncbi:MAG TPA: DUF2933 domain-containing protein [Hyphomicrobium sp.]|jgi:Protein of unknown function (DUF2933)|nr:DUF2933 domain-containing protein [Hyphomicrobium sp.]